MQIDMHYYSTYVLAAAAGFPKESAEVIAYSSQYVDDQNTILLRITGTQEGILGIPTAHHPVDAGKRATQLFTRSIDDSRLVWVPFHFLPGGEGETFEDRVICRKDSAIANEMMQHHIKVASGNTFGLEMMGIVSHVYMDTFSHYGFSGIPSERNEINELSLRFDDHDRSTVEKMKAKLIEFKDSYQTLVGELPHLGHGAAGTYPDMPFLKWDFTYSDGRTCTRNNPETFLEGCEKLHGHLMAFAKALATAEPHFALTSAVPFSDIKPVIADILGQVGESQQRAEYWLTALGEGHFGQIPVCENYDADKWGNELEQLLAGNDAQALLDSGVYRFHSAAEYHRHYVLKQLLPSNRLMVA